MSLWDAAAAYLKCLVQRLGEEEEAMDRHGDAGDAVDDVYFPPDVGECVVGPYIPY